MNKLKIAVSGRLIKDGSYDYVYVNTDYLRALDQADAIGIPVTPYMNAQEMAESCAGLLITGGADVNPKLYHQECDPTVKEFSDWIDASDLRLIDAFLKANKPIFGICRGLQILNVYYGGTLVQNIENHNQEEERHHATHLVYPKENTHLYELLGNEVMVNSLHHQIIDQLGEGLTVNALSPEGYIEGIENEHLIAVQWHPEALIADAKQLSLFQDFIHRCQLG